MNNAIVYLTAIGFAISIFPLHVINYVYVSTAEKYASVNVTLYKLITVLNANTQKLQLQEEKKDDIKDNDKKSKTIMTATRHWMTIYDHLCITKIVQLGDYGIGSQAAVYAALMQNALTGALYAFVRINGGKTKLKNYSILNYEHDNVNYYLKLVGVINVVSFLRLLLLFLWEKINER